MAEALACQRALFDIPDDVAYINCAYLSPLMRAVADAGHQGVDRKVHPWTITRREFYAELDAVRGGFARLIGATADDIAIVPSSSYAAATAAANLPLASGQTVVVIAGEHGSNVRIWHHLARDAGASITTVARPADDDWTSAVLAAISPATGIVALPPLHWTDGSTLDLARIGTRARELGAAFVVDATQAVGAVPIDVAELKPDFLMCSAYKWLLSPYSIGFLYAAPHRQAGRPLEQHSFNRAGAEQSEGSTDYPEAFEPGARRYDVGERSNFIALPMLKVALDQLNAWGPARIAASTRPITERIVSEAAKLGLRAPAAAFRSPHIVGLTRPGKTFPADLGQRLAARKVYVSIRGPAIRISPHVYNNAADVERLIALLAREAG
ncbi:MAG TPA: aminotransferase class V-fold PLP-dependent enzyme [Hyphomicrobiaceae bacterium]|nr:aminotransferase class V-fold PLP-dependent enzyme [Hyphomicrobiaceae bacterium]